MYKALLKTFFVRCWQWEWAEDSGNSKTFDFKQVRYAAMGVYAIDGFSQ